MITLRFLEFQSTSGQVFINLQDISAIETSEADECLNIFTRSGAVFSVFASAEVIIDVLNTSFLRGDINFDCATVTEIKKIARRTPKSKKK